VPGTPESATRGRLQAWSVILTFTEPTSAVFKPRAPILPGYGWITARNPFERRRMSTNTERPAANAPGARNSQPLRKGRARRLVLLVEDEPHELQIYGGVLLYNGFDVAYAPDGATALELAAHHHPDLVVLDLGLPDVHGFDLCARLRRMAGLQDVPVLVLSGFSRREYGGVAASMGCSDFLEKPVGPVEVLHVAERLLGR
jgi:CheY-like chemotaxis protein